MKHTLFAFFVLSFAFCGAENVDIWDTKPLGPAVKVPAIPKPRVQRKAVLNRVFKPLKGEDLILSRNACIVTDRETENRIAARLLSQKVKASSGYTLPVLDESKVKIVQKNDRFTVSANGKTFDYVVFIGGKTPLTNKMDAAKLPEQGFQIRCIGNAMLIAGNDTGPSHAVVDFLEQYGFRSLWPGKSGQVVPKMTEFKVKPFEVSDHPALLWRGMRCEPKYTARPWKLSAKEKTFFTPEEFGKISCAAERPLLGLRYLQLPPRYLAMVPRERSEWALWQRIGNGKHKVSAGHSYGNWWKKYGKEHPEYFALLKDGTRHPLPKANPSREQLCFSNPATIKAIAAERLAQAKAQNRTSVSLAPNDGGKGNAPCMCVRCRRLDPPNGPEIMLPTRDRYVALSDRLFHCFNQIAGEILKERPDLKIGVLAYSQYATAPLYVKVHPKMTVGYVGLTYADSKTRDKGRESWARWAGAAEQLFWRPNLFYPTHGVMINFARDVAKDMRNMYCTGMIGTDIDTFGSDWSTMGLSYYVVARMLWNPALSAGEMIDDYCEKGFNSAAKEMKAYFNLQETLTRRNADMAAGRARLQATADADNDDPAQTVYSLSWAKFGRNYTEADFEKLQALLNQAKKAANADQEVLERIDFLQLGLDFTRARIRLYKLSYGKEGTKAQIIAAMQKMYEIMIQAGLHNPHALSIAHIAWWDGRGGTWSRFGWKVVNPPRDKAL